MYDDYPLIMNTVLGALLKKTVVPVDFKSQSEAVNTMLTSDSTGLVDSLTDFAVESATVPFEVETTNPEFTKTLRRWLATVNIEYNGKIPTGIVELSKEYYKERWKGASFPILKIAGWTKVNGINVPNKMFFVDGGSVNAKDKEDNKELQLLNYEYYLGEDEKLDKGVIITKPYSRWYDKYPIPFLIKRGIYQNWLLIENLKNKQAEVLEQVIPYLFLIKKGSENLAVNDIQIYSDDELKETVKRFKDMVSDYETKRNAGGTNTPIRASQFDEELKHFLPDLKSMFDTALFAGAEKNILTGLGFVDVVEAVSTSRRESILNPKAFIEEVNTGVKDFKSIIRDLVLRIIIANKSSHKKYMSDNIEFYISSSPVTNFMTDKFRNQVRQLWERGLFSNQSYCELVGEVEYRTEMYRREKESKRGDEVKMSPHQTKYIEETDNSDPTSEDDSKGDPISEEKLDPIEKQEFDAGSLEGSPYKNIKQLPKSIRDNMTVELQKVFTRSFNQAFQTYEDETRAFRVAWSVIKKIGKKNKQGLWQRKKKRSEGKLKKVRLTKAMIEESLEDEKNEVIDENIKIKNQELTCLKLDNEKKKEKLYDKLLADKSKD